MQEWNTLSSTSFMENMRKKHECWLYAELELNIFENMGMYLYKNYILWLPLFGNHKLHALHVVCITNV